MTHTSPNTSNAMPSKHVLGIVGGIGAGKSMVAAELARIGGSVIPADTFGHEALREPEILAKAKARWGNAILNPDGSVARRPLGKIVFADKQELDYLESLVFPFIERKIVEAIQKGQADAEVDFLVLDAAILLETGWQKHCDKVLYVDVPRSVRLERLRASRGWDDAELTRREGNQLPVEEKKRRSDAVVDNQGSPEQLNSILREVLDRWGWKAKGK